MPWWPWAASVPAFGTLTSCPWRCSTSGSIRLAGCCSIRRGCAGGMGSGPASLDMLLVGIRPPSLSLSLPLCPCLFASLPPSASAPPASSASQPLSPCPLCPCLSTPASLPPLPLCFYPLCPCLSTIASAPLPPVLLPLRPPPPLPPPPLCLAPDPLPFVRALGPKPKRAGLHGVRILRAGAGCPRDFCGRGGYSRPSRVHFS